MGAHLAAGCAFAGDDTDARASRVISALLDADDALLQSRPVLVAGKYSRMSANRFDFLRGTFPVFLRDVRDPSSPVGERAPWGEGVTALGIGDVHPENFGVAWGVDGTPSFEPNDFDAADRWPVVWELRRLASALIVGMRSARNDAATTRDAANREVEASVVRALVQSYFETLQRISVGDAPAAAVTPEELASPVLADLFARARRGRDGREELATLLAPRDAADSRGAPDTSPPVFVRGVLDPDEPDAALVDASPSFLRAFDRLAPSANTRDSALGAHPEYLSRKDAVRELGSGVASYPRLRFLVLVEGETLSPSDDFVVEVKELSDSHHPQLGGGAGVLADDVATRVRMAAHALWSRDPADPFFGTVTMLGLPWLVRTESEGNKTLRVRRFTGMRGTAEALVPLARVLGRRLASIHAVAPAVARRIARRTSAATDLSSALAAESRIALDYADLVEADYATFVAWREAHGALLGYRRIEGDGPTDEQRALFAESGAAAR